MTGIVASLFQILGIPEKYGPNIITGLDISTAIFGILSAIFWFWSSTVKYTKAKDVVGKMKIDSPEIPDRRLVDEPQLLNFVSQTAIRNRLAAIASALTALSFSIAILLRFRWPL